MWSVCCRFLVGMLPVYARYVVGLSCGSCVFGMLSLIKIIRDFKIYKGVSSTTQPSKR